MTDKMTDKQLDELKLRIGENGRRVLFCLHLFHLDPKQPEIRASDVALDIARASGLSLQEVVEAFRLLESEGLIQPTGENDA